MHRYGSPLLRPHEAAAVLGGSRSLLAEAVQRGLLRPVLAGNRRTLYRIEDLAVVTCLVGLGGQPAGSNTSALPVDPLPASLAAGAIPL